MGDQALPPFGWHAVVTQWQFSPVVTSLAAVLAVLYLYGAWRVARRHPARPWPCWRTGMFLGGLAVMVMATESGIGAYDDVLFWNHMIQHLMLIMIAPAMLVVGRPVTLLLHASRNPLHTWAKRLVRSRVLTALTWPPFVVGLYIVTIVGTHLTGLLSLMTSNPALHDTEHALYVVVGYLFFLPVLGGEPIRWRISYPSRLFILFLTMPVDTFTGLVLGYSNSPVNSGEPPPSWAPSPISDLHSGGAVMWIGGDGIMFVIMMLVFLVWSRDGRISASGGGWLEAARRASFTGLTGAGQPGQASAGTTGGSADTAAAATAAAPGGRTARRDDGTIDDDEHLAAYNEYLARVNAAETRGAARKPR